MIGIDDFARSGVTPAPTAVAVYAEQMRIRASLIAVVAAVALAVPLVSPTAALAAPSSDRISGADRYSTSAKVSSLAFPSPSTIDTLYLVSGQNFPDALSAGPVAVRRSAAFLLTSPTAVPAAITKEIRRLNPRTVVLVGGEGALTAKLEKSVRSLVPEVVRVGGTDRYATSRAVVKDAFSADGAPHVYIATGASFPDALAAGPAAAAAGAPVVLLRGDTAKIDAATVKLLRELGTTSVTITGGVAVVSAGIEAQLKSLYGKANVVRDWGADRYETAIAINKRAFGATRGDAYVATGLNFPDALAAAPLAGMQGRPLYLTVPHCALPTLRKVLVGTTVTRIRLVGGTGVIRGLVGQAHSCLSLTSPTSEWVMVNKRNPLRPANYAPSDLVLPRTHNVWDDRLRNVASEALAQMFAQANREGAGQMTLQSGYRSYSTQAALYQNDSNSLGTAAADRLTARPGHSEHQTGFTADISAYGGGCSFGSCFATTPQGRWLAANSWRYGYILRYGNGQTSITGYDYEPWHFRYVGKALAADYQAGGFRTLEQYFGYPPAPDY